jgi:hypothetical protein
VENKNPAAKPQTLCLPKHCTVNGHGLLRGGGQLQSVNLVVAAAVPFAQEGSANYATNTGASSVCVYTSYLIPLHLSRLVMTKTHHKLRTALRAFTVRLRCCVQPTSPTLSTVQKENPSDEPRDPPAGAVPPTQLTQASPTLSAVQNESLAAAIPSPTTTKSQEARKEGWEMV